MSPHGEDALVPGAGQRSDAGRDAYTAARDLTVNFNAPGPGGARLGGGGVVASAGQVA